MCLMETRTVPFVSRGRVEMRVELPKTDWYWLDDLVSREYAGMYVHLFNACGLASFSSQKRLSAELMRTARAHGQKQIERLYNLANDNISKKEGSGNAPASKMDNVLSLDIGFHNKNYDLSLKMPSAYRLFHFMPHATSLTTVWERRNYHLKTQGVLPPVA